MGIYVNPGNGRLSADRTREIYVDKSLMLSELNHYISHNINLVCVSRPRRFGKTMAANMIAAYYSRGCDSHNVFSGLEISSSPDFETYLNSFTVIKLDMNGVVNKKGTLKVSDFIDSEVVPELRKTFPGILPEEKINLPMAVMRIFFQTGERFVFIIDEYDVIFREQEYISERENYVSMLTALFKGDDVRQAVALVYLTGILPVLKDKAQSKLNDFRELTMLDAENLAGYFGFTENEVLSLCIEKSMDFDEVKRWYDGYRLNGVEIYSPKSVVTAVEKKRCDDYWTQTASYEALQDLVLLNVDGLRDDITFMICGSEVPVNIRKFRNSALQMKSRDEVLTCLIHLGYLGYDMDREVCFIPNHEIRNEWILSVEDNPDFSKVIAFVRDSRCLLEATWNRDSYRVAQSVKETHMFVSGSLTFNNEGAFQSAIRLAYFYADSFYYVFSELPAGKGFADIVFIPYVAGVPAMMVELKRNDSHQSGIAQIKKREYPKALKNFNDRILAVAISYDGKTKEHQCIIEEFQISL